MGWYLRAYFREQRTRVLLTVSGLSLALASVFVAYGVAAWVDQTSSKALSFVIRGGSLWIIPAEGVRLEPTLGAIVSLGKLPSNVGGIVTAADRAAVVRRIAVGKVRINDMPAVLYATDAQLGSSILVSTEMWQSMGRKSINVTLQGRSALVVGSDVTLPASAISGSFEIWANSIDETLTPSWILVESARPRLVAEALSTKLGAHITDSPNDIIQADATPRPLTAFLLNASLSRFDPFSFRTKFSSLMLSATMSTVFGWVARLVFLVGLGLSITSTVIGVQEKRHEVSLFAALGHQTGFTTLLLAESVIVSALSFAVGSMAATLALSRLVPYQVLGGIIGPSLVMGSTYAILLVIISPLVAAQQVASRRAIDLVREGLSY